MTVDLDAAASSRRAGRELVRDVLAHQISLLELVEERLVDPRSDESDPGGDRQAVASLVTTARELVRAMSAAASTSEPQPVDDTVRTRVIAYVRRHLRDPDLSVARIAETHHMSRRTLYNLWGNQRETLSAWIMRQRLEGARRDLADPLLSTCTVTSIACRWGFADAAHFHRRFRSAYGTSPGAWRRVCGEPLPT